MEVLLIGDDDKTADEISMYLRIRYPEVSIVRTRSGTGIMERVNLSAPDLLILHSFNSGPLMVDLIKTIRQATEIPLLVMGNNENGEERALGIEAGADEFITRPYSLLEFLARCGAIIRRTGTHPEGRVIIFNGLEIHLNSREVFLSGERVRLTPIEYEILAKLAQDNGHIVDQDILLEHVWGSEYRGDANLLKTYVYRLRRKLERGKGGKLIVNERGFGYRLARTQLKTGLEAPVN